MIPDFQFFSFFGSEISYWKMRGGAVWRRLEQ
jgi:hypothetical protein